MKCLEKDRSRRYETANDVAIDLKRHLGNEPVIARPPSAGYRFQKAWRRNKLTYSAGIAVTTALVIGLGLSTWLFVRESRAYKAARAAEASEKFQRAKAESASRQAEANELVARQQAYGADINLAQQALSNGKLGVALDLLNQPGFEDERGWEWRYLWQETRSEASGVFTTMPHGVSHVAASPDGSFLAISTSSGQLQLWDPVTRKMLSEFPSRGDILPAFSRTGSLFAYLGPHTSRTNQTCVCIWDPHRHQLVAKVPAGPCRGIAFSADEKTLVTCSSDGANVTRWQLPEAREISTFYCDHPPRYDNSAVPFAITPDARLAAVGGFSGEVILADLEADKELWRSQVNDGRGYSLAFSPDRTMLAVGTGSKAGYILILDALTGREMLRLHGHHSAISALAFWPDGARLASSSFDQRIGIWDLRDLSNIPPARMLRGHKLEVWSLALMSDARTLASGCKDGEVCVWNTTDRQTQTFTTSANFRMPNGPEFAGAPATIWCLSMNGPAVRGVDLTTGDLLEWNDSSDALQRIPMGFTPGARRGCWSRDGHLLAVGSTDGMVQIWELPARTLITEFSSGHNQVTPLQFEIAGHRLALANDTAFEVWTFSPTRRTFSAQIPLGYRVTDYSGYIAFSAELAPNLDRVPVAPLTNTASGSRFLWVPATNEIIKLQADARENSSFGNDVNGVAFSPDGTLMAVSAFSGMTQVYDTRTGLRVATLRGFFNGASSVAFSPDGRRLVVGSAGDGDIKLYDVATWKELITIPSGAELVVGAGFSQDGACLHANLSDDFSTAFIRSWRPKSMEQISLAQAKEKLESRSP
jgi:WD40 repeat protein